MPIENIQEFRWWRLERFFLRTFDAGLQSGQRGWTKEPLAGPRGLHKERKFVQEFRPSSEAVGLSQVNKMLRQLTGQISAHYSSSAEIRNTHLEYIP